MASLAPRISSAAIRAVAAAALATGLAAAVLKRYGLPAMR